MTRSSIPFWLSILSGLVCASAAGTLHAEMSATDVVRAMDQKTTGRTSQGRMEIKILRTRNERTLELEAYGDKDADRFFIRIIRPSKDRGTTFLKWGDNLWQYIPKIGREVKIEGSLLQDSWMGSDFSNDDLVRATNVVDDYTHAFLPGAAAGTYKVELKPKPTAPVVWSRVTADIRQSDFLPLRQEFYDHKNRLVRVMEYFDIKQMGGRTLPTRIEMSTIKNNEVQSKTQMTLIQMLYDAPIPPDVFSKANLRR